MAGGMAGTVLTLTPGKHTAMGASVGFRSRGASSVPERCCATRVSGNRMVRRGGRQIAMRGSPWATTRSVASVP